MKTRSGIYVDVSERPGEIVVTVRSSVPASESAVRTLAAVINGLVDQRPSTEIAARGFITGTDPGWAMSLKPLGAKRAAAGLKAISGILTVDEARTLRGLLTGARKWAEHPSMLTYVEGAHRLLTRSRVTRTSLAALRAAPLAAPETDASEGDPDLRWARPVVHDPGHERVWEPCKPTDDGAVLVVLP